MTETERRIKKRVQFVVAASMAVFFCLLVTLAAQLSVRANQRALERRLVADHRELADKISKTEDEIESMADADRFRDEWLLREYGYGKNGSKIFG
jgi:cell division protein FtsB